MPNKFMTNVVFAVILLLKKCYTALAVQLTVRLQEGKGTHNE
jgi:hypothetical protein